MSSFSLVLLRWHEKEARTDRWRGGNEYRTQTCSYSSWCAGLPISSFKYHQSMTDLECTATPLPTCYCGLSFILVRSLFLSLLDGCYKQKVHLPKLLFCALSPFTSSPTPKSSQLNPHLAGPCDPPPSSPSVALQWSAQSKLLGHCLSYTNKTRPLFSICLSCPSLWLSSKPLFSGNLVQTSQSPGLSPRLGASPRPDWHLVCADSHLLCRDCVPGCAVTRTAGAETFILGKLRCSHSYITCSSSKSNANNSLCYWTLTMFETLFWVGHVMSYLSHLSHNNPYEENITQNGTN